MSYLTIAYIILMTSGLGSILHYSLRVTKEGEKQQALKNLRLLIWGFALLSTVILFYHISNMIKYSSSDETSRNSTMAILIPKIAYTAVFWTLGYFIYKLPDGCDINDPINDEILGKLKTTIGWSLALSILLLIVLIINKTGYFSNGNSSSKSTIDYSNPFDEPYYGGNPGSSISMDTF